MYEITSDGSLQLIGLEDPINETFKSGQLFNEAGSPSICDQSIILENYQPDFDPNHEELLDGDLNEMYDELDILDNRVQVQLENEPPTTTTALEQLEEATVDVNYNEHLKTLDGFTKSGNPRKRKKYVHNPKKRKIIKKTKKNKDTL